MSSDAKKHVATCDSCMSVNEGDHHNEDLLQPLPVPTRPWQCISMDFITSLPVSVDGYEAILTFMDQLMKCVRLIPVKSAVCAEGTVTIFSHFVLRLSIACNQDPRFTATFSNEVFKAAGNIECSTPQR